MRDGPRHTPRQPEEAGRFDRYPARRAARTRAVALLSAAALAACSDGSSEIEVEVRVAEGSSALDIARQLEGAGLIEHPRVFALFAQLRGSAGDLKSGRYRFREGAGWTEVLSLLERGAVVTEAITVPEGFGLRDIAARLARLSVTRPEAIVRLASDTALVRELGVPGPTLEGYLFPETYRFAEGVSPAEALGTMTRRYRTFWSEERRARADSLGLTEREVVTLASIVEKEARLPEERPIIAGVYLNRLRLGMRLQADPTVQYALGAQRDRLLYRDIESVADHAYNTYTHTGLPPGPIASPGEAALLATLYPADVPYRFFVARPDGSHVFSRTEREHINAKNRIRREVTAGSRREGGE